MFPTTEDFDDHNNLKTITEYKYNDDGKMVKVVKTYKVERRRVPKSIARRKNWRKFGAAESDPPGPNPSNTIVQIILNKESKNQDQAEEDPLSKLKSQKLVSCRICKGDHWTTKCPYKDTLAPIQCPYKDTLAPIQDTMAPIQCPYKDTLAPIQDTMAPIQCPYKDTLAPIQCPYKDTLAPIQCLYKDTLAPTCMQVAYSS
ncbi:hypothetical protein DPMN_152252 [Dreissena polymorpha]|uniref:Eukaryotic translation initiation factor 3 subunit G N-terminal domain-containing protein n=1 Tax=Dreissena polymorpha TaxID=45954 RepID=A0A9D4J500_DREPO|nr:hypothetical protein DPMN_152252 [Dreissena polymorpha]